MANYYPTYGNGSPYTFDQRKVYQGYGQPPANPADSQIERTAASIQPDGQSALDRQSRSLNQMLARDRTRREMTLNAGIATGFQGAQTAVSFIPTAADRRVKKELGELEAKERSGALGLDPDERAMLEREQMDPVRSFATEARQRQEAQMAGMGQSSARNLMQARRAQQDAVSDAARKAGLAIAQADLMEKRNEQQRIADLTQAKANRQRQQIESVGQFLGQAAGLTGRVMQARAAPGFDVDALKAKGLGDDEIQSIMDDVRGAKTARKRADVLSFWSGYSPRQGE